MSQISKCPKIRAFLSYWEALGEVSELRYKNLPHAVIKSIIYLYIQPYLMPWLFGERSWISPTQLLQPLLQLCDSCCLNSQQSVVLRSQRVGLSHIFDSIAALTVYNYATCLLLTGVCTPRCTTQLDCLAFYEVTGDWAQFSSYSQFALLYRPILENEKKKQGGRYEMIKIKI